jgi:hypothetical protein
MKMTEWEAYDVKARRRVKVLDAEVKQLKNGRWAVVGKSAATGTKVFRFLNKNQVRALGKA